jgi:hypothetical protein
MYLNSNQIINFWDWFKTISADLLEYATNKNLINQIDIKVSQLGNFDWEIGPFEEVGFFAISPNLDIEKLSYTKQIIDMAPQCDGWHFLPSKPVKTDWKGIWKMKNEFGKEIHVDSNSWRYILYALDDGTFYTDVAISDIDGNTDTQYLAIDIAFTGYLGEENYMYFIKNIKIVGQLEADTDAKSTSLRFIKKHRKYNIWMKD